MKNWLSIAAGHGEDIKQVYQSVIALGMLCHLLYTGAFAFWRIPVLSWYNGASVAFYAFMMWTVAKGCYRFAVSAIHSEVCLFVIVSTLCTGWETGFWMFQLAMVSLVYFCPYKHKFIPYLFSLAHVIVFLLLRTYTSAFKPWFVLPWTNVMTWLFIGNACAGFAVILYAAYSAGVSARVNTQKLSQENAALSELANHDTLTGLLSRRSLLEQVQQGMGQCVIIGDIDDFKSINDTYGHACGDYVLKELARLMEENCPTAFICRWGGEEFLLLLPSSEPEEMLEQIQKLCKAIGKALFSYKGTRFRITATFGVAHAGEAESFESLLELADQRLYQGKRNGKNQVMAWPYPEGEPA